MTKPQIWVAAFLLLFIILFMIGRITKEEEPMKDFSSMNNSPMTGQETNSELTGDKLYPIFRMYQMPRYKSRRHKSGSFTYRIKRILES